VRRRGAGGAPRAAPARARTEARRRRALHRGGAIPAAGRPADAEASARRIIESDPDHVPSLRLLGVVRDTAGDHAAAADLFARVAELAPDDADAYYNMGTSLLALARAEEAAVHLRRALALAPRNAKGPSTISGARCARYAAQRG
jgi:tetratricopeptide (TPR) repeat protein